MHARELVDLASVLSAHGSMLIRHPGPLAHAGLEEYWIASKCRLDRWSHRLGRTSGCGTTIATETIATKTALVEEVLSGEVLVRVWAAVACAHDRLQGCDNAEPVARSVLIGHLEARHRVLTLLLSAKVDAEEAIRLDRLRRRAERWTDVLVGHLCQADEVAEFAFDPDRAADFAQDLRQQGQQPGGRHVWSLLQSSLRAAFHRDLSAVSPNADLNARIAGGILACFPTEVFDSTGLPRSLWSLRLAQTAADAQCMLSQLLAPDPPPVLSSSRSIRRRFGA